MMGIATRGLKAIASIAGLAIIIAISTVEFWIGQGDPTIPQLDDKWWGGYYETTTFGKVWCIARFNKRSTGDLQMTLWSEFGQPEVFKVDRTSSDQEFVHLTFVDSVGKVQIEAKQLYSGERYFVGRLLAGRFGDFWKENNDIAIRGYIDDPRREFGIEPMRNDQVKIFWRKAVRPNDEFPRLAIPN